MPLNTAILDADIGYILADLPTVATFSGATYTGSRSTLRLERLPSDEGLRASYRFSWYGQASDFSTLPVVGQILTIASVEYRIVHVEVDNTQQLARFDLGEKYASGP